MSVSSKEAKKLSSQADVTDSLAASDEMHSGAFVPSRLTLRIYHRLTSFAVYCMSTSATAVLILLLLFWYYGGVCLLCALLVAVLGESRSSCSVDTATNIGFILDYLNHLLYLCCVNLVFN